MKGAEEAEQAEEDAEEGAKELLTRVLLVRLGCGHRALCATGVAVSTESVRTTASTEDGWSREVGLLEVRDLDSKKAESR